MKNLRQNISGKSRKAILPLALVTTSLVSSHPGAGLKTPTAVMVTKNLNSKRHKVRLFTASDYKTLLFTVDGVPGLFYRIYVFDLDGKLVTESVIRNRETGILHELPAGNYLYEVLAEDTRVENGQLKVK